MTLITLRAYDEDDDNNKKEYQVPVDDLGMTLTDLYDIVFSLTDIPPQTLVLYHNNLPIQRPTPSKTLRDAGITVPTTIEFGRLSSDERARANANNEGRAQTVTKARDGNDVQKESNRGVGREASSSSSSVQITKSNNNSIDMGKANESLKLALYACLNPSQRTNINEFSARLKIYMQQVKEYERKDVQQRALQVVPISKLQEQSKTNLLQNGGNEQISLLKELLKWFKRDFFKWVNNPSCYNCGETDNTKINFLRAEQPSRQEYLNGKASRSEVFQCLSCGAEIRFTRYEDALYLLLHSRKGRCGEWAKAFTLVCRSLGYTVRMVHDWTDHVWTEVFIDGKWYHCDSCEESFDEPLMYETGWGKKLTYCIGTSNEYVMDVTKRYTKDLAQLQGRDKGMEVQLSWVIAKLNEDNDHVLSSSQKEQRREQWESDVYWLNRNVEEEGRKDGEHQGRQSGSEEWVKARGEDGSSR